MNFNTCEINNWYTTNAGKINSKLIISAINKITKPSFEKNILYIGSKVIIKELMNQNYNFNSFYISDSQNADIIAETKKLPFQDSSID